MAAAVLAIGLSGAAYRLASASAAGEAVAAAQGGYVAQDPLVAARSEGIASASAAAADMAPAADDPAGARAEVPVVVYTTTWCPACKRAKAWLARNGIRYEERDIEASRENARRMRGLNPRGSVPTIVVDSDSMIGFSETNMRAMLDRAGRRRAVRGK